ncbi:MAG: protein kinase domain-containing protein [Hyphomicrobiales bacterium]
MALAPGTRLGPYEIVDLLGKGGMGEVYRARDPRLGRDVAVKVLPRSVAGDRDRQQRFEAEARAAGSLNHPNIITLHDVGIADGAPYLVTEILEGENLREIARRGPLAPERALQLVSEVAVGLAAAHGKGIVHRDLKPENLFVLPDGRVKILDFGIAKLTRTEAAPDAEAETTPVFASLTATGTLMGTVSYMAPEQLRDRPVDQRADLFALGAILYELLTGTQPFHGDTAADRVSAILTAEAPPLPAEVEEAVPGLGLLVARLLAKRPENRFHSAADFLFALELIRAHRPAPAAGARPAPGGAAGTPSASHDVQFKQLTFRDGDIVAARFAPDGQTVVYEAAWGGAPSDVYITRVESPEASAIGLPDVALESVSSSAEMALVLRSRDLGGFISLGTLARMPMVGGRPREVANDVYMADWSPDGRSLAAIRMVDGRLQLEAPLGRVVHKASGWITYPRWSPDGSTIAFGEHPQMGNNMGYLSVVRPGESARRLTPLFEMVSRTVWRPDSREVWFGGQMEGSAGVYGASLEGTVRRVYSAPGWPIVTDIAKNGDALLAMIRPRMRLETGLRFAGAESVVDLSWLDWSLLRDMSPDGSTIVFDETGLGTGGTHAIYMRRTNGEPAIRLADGIVSVISADGRWVMAGDDRAPTTIRAVPTGAGATRAYDLAPLSLVYAEWIGATEEILVIGAEPDRPRRIWRFDPSSGSRRGVAEEFTPGGAALTSPDGRFALVRSAEGQPHLLELDSGRLTTFDRLEPGYRPAGWAGDSASAFFFQGGEVPARVVRLDIASGAVEPWMEVRPSQRSGVVGVNSVRLSADGERYACSYPMIDSSLYLARGLV